MHNQATQCTHDFSKCSQQSARKKLVCKSTVEPWEWNEWPSRRWTSFVWCSTSAPLQGKSASNDQSLRAADRDSHWESEHSNVIQGQPMELRYGHRCESCIQWWSRTARHAFCHSNDEIEPIGYTDGDQEAVPLAVWWPAVPHCRLLRRTQWKWTPICTALVRAALDFQMFDCDRDVHESWDGCCDWMQQWPQSAALQIECAIDPCGWVRAANHLLHRRQSRWGLEGQVAVDERNRDIRMYHDFQNATSLTTLSSTFHEQSFVPQCTTFGHLFELWSSLLVAAMLCGDGLCVENVFKRFAKLNIL